MRPMRSKPWLTAPEAPRLPPFLEKAVRTLVAVRLRLSVSASTMMATPPGPRSEEHTSELQSLMRISYAVFCLKYKQTTHPYQHLQCTSTHYLYYTTIHL